MLTVGAQRHKRHLGWTKQERFDLVISVCSAGLGAGLRAGKYDPSFATSHVTLCNLCEFTEFQNIHLKNQNNNICPTCHYILLGQPKEIGYIKAFWNVCPA